MKPAWTFIMLIALTLVVTGCSLAEKEQTDSQKLRIEDLDKDDIIGYDSNDGLTVNDVPVDEIEGFVIEENKNWQNK